MLQNKFIPLFFIQTNVDNSEADQLFTGKFLEGFKESSPRWTLAFVLRGNHNE